MFSLYVSPPPPPLGLFSFSAVCEEAFRLHEIEPGKIASESLGEVMRCPGCVRVLWHAL